MERKSPLSSVVVLLSGGLDSTVLLHHLMSESKDVFAVSFYYGQIHARELESAKYFTKKLGIRHRVVELPDIFAGSLVGDGAIPHGRYDEEQQKKTTVPNRNMVMLSAAAAIAIDNLCDTVAYAAHKDDFGIYPDCRPEFISAMHEVLRKCHYWPINLLTPFIWMSKRDIVARGIELGVEMDKTWSCYEGKLEPCGKCGACDARARAFA